MYAKLASTAEDISQIAFGFMASKALFAGLHLDILPYLIGKREQLPRFLPRRTSLSIE
jgi:hypothetical protein